MSRAYSRNPAVHREFDSRLKGGGQRGDDVEKLAAATRKRKGARGYPEAAKPPRTDTWSRNLSDHVADALFALGAAESTITAARAGRVTEGAQRMVRFPGLRSAAQLQRAAARDADVAKRAERARDEAAQAAPLAAPGRVAEQRARAAAAASFAVEHNGRNYTQGPRRWDPIRSAANPNTGKMFSYGDCSAFATWVLWHALGRPTVGDIVNGADWTAGYTGTMVRHGERVTSGHYQPGDCGFYGSGTMSHVVVCYRAGDENTALWASFGSQGGPFTVKLKYRRDYNHTRRYLGV